MNEIGGEGVRRAQVDCEAFEGLWHAVGHKTQQGTFFQALIQIAAANLKRFLGNEQAATNLARGGLTSTIEAKYP